MSIVGHSVGRFILSLSLACTASEGFAGSYGRGSASASRGIVKASYNKRSPAMAHPVAYSREATRESLLFGGKVKRDGSIEVFQDTTAKVREKNTNEPKGKLTVELLDSKGSVIHKQKFDTDEEVEYIQLSKKSKHDKTDQHFFVDMPLKGRPAKYRLTYNGRTYVRPFPKSGIEP